MICIASSKILYEQRGSDVPFGFLVLKNLGIARKHCLAELLVPREEGSRHEECYSERDPHKRSERVPRDVFIGSD